MDKLTAVEHDLTKAREALTALQDELPQFHALLSENEAEQVRLKTERTPLDAQAQARGRVQIAREMLEQHQSDIATARAEVTRLEQRLAREQTLDKMVERAHRAQEHRAALERTVAGAVEDLQRAAVTIIQEWTAFEGARQEFIAAGAEELGTVQWVSDPLSMGLRGEQAGRLQERVFSVLDAIQGRGADLHGLLDGEVVDLKYRIKYQGEKPLPAEGLAMLVWSAVLAHDDVPHSLKRGAPKPKQSVHLRAVSAPDRYSI